ncbi:MAG: diacylglycerol kinase family protein [Saprospiraceae bacterium]|nr:diacylglycerol kinase family protein [Saprospiraceae bacterium]
MLKGRILSFKYAFTGLWTLVRTQPNARIHAIATIVVIVTGVYFQVARDEWLWLAAAIGGVWVSEAFNTALEFLTDLVSPDHHPLAGHAKDVAAGAVLIAALTAIVIAAIIFGPYFLGVIH